MEVIVASINTKSNNVLVKSEVGNIWGKWCTDVLPELKKYDIEIDCDDMVKIEDIEIVDIPQMLILSEEEKNYLYGFVEDIQENVLFIRVLIDIIMIEVSLEVDINEFFRRYVRIKVKHFNFYDTGMI